MRIISAAEDFIQLMYVNYQKMLMKESRRVYPAGHAHGESPEYINQHESCLGYCTLYGYKVIPPTS